MWQKTNFVPGESTTKPLLSNNNDNRKDHKDDNRKDHKDDNRKDHKDDNRKDQKALFFLFCSVMINMNNHL